MADNKIAIREKDVIQLLRNFLEETERVECLLTFEKCTGSSPANLPQELSSLRKIVLSGRLGELQKHLFEPFQELGDEEERQRCRYAVVKQQYLELLLEVTEDTSDSLKQLIFQLESLCPSREEFKVLLSLLTLPSFDDVPEYKEWTVLRGRMQCFYQLASWMSKILGTKAATLRSTSSFHSVNHSLTENRLVQLLAKGLMYEQCEAVCANSQAEDNRGTGKVLDLFNWIKHQPDSAFQLSPASVQLVVQTTESGQSSDSIKCEDYQNKGHTKKLDTFTNNSHQITHSTADQQSSGDGDQPKAVEKTEEVGGTTKQEENFTSSASEDESKSALVSRGNDGCDGGGSKEMKASIKSYSEDPAVKESKVAVDRVSTPASIVHIPSQLMEDMMKFDDNFIDGASHLVEGGISQHRSEINLSGKIVHQEAILSSTSAPVLPAQPMGVAMKKSEDKAEETPEIHTLKKGRKSSTPKPSSSKHCSRHPSPSTSPVPYVPPSRDFTSENRFYSAAKKQIDFTENDESVVFPKAQLLAHVKDKQVVRSVAFSESGDVVAIGANSRTLRLCSTERLLQETTSCRDENLLVFYCAQNYHKGSVYCMAWWGDTLLASGSNDQTIRLLSYNPTSQVSALTSLGQIKCHKGTVRDLTFTSDGLLVSGGVGDNLVKISNPETGQVVNTLYGHYDQILSLYVIKENILASASQDKTVKLWDLRLGSSFATIQHPHPVTSVAASVHLNQVASAQLDGSCMIHDLTTLETLSTYNAHSDECRTVRYSSFDQGHWLLSSSYDGTVCLADTTTWEWQQVAQHRNKVVQCRWHRTAPLFASTGADNRASFWRLEL